LGNTEAQVNGLVRYLKCPRKEMFGLRRRGRLILILVLGTRSEVWHASGFVARARERVA
jgi:hypothetical protein